MYKKYNSSLKNLSPYQNGLHIKQTNSLSQVAERLVPFLIIASTFVWLWK